MRITTIAAAALIASAAPTCAAAPARHNDSVTDASARANEAVFRRACDIWMRGRTEQLGEVIGPGYVGHTSAGDRDAAGLAARIRKFHELYTDLGFTILDQLAEGDRVATRMRITGTVRATNRPVTMIGLNISRFARGRIVEEWPVWEMVSDKPRAAAGR